MPALPIDRYNAWDAFKKGRIAATNVGISTDALNSTPILRNLAVKKGYNAIRLWLNYGEFFTLLPEDWRVIANNGWTGTVAQNTPTTLSKKVYDDDTSVPKVSQLKTIYQVYNQVKNILDRCTDVGMGVILTGDFFSEAGGRLWTNQAAGNDGASNMPHLATTASGLQNDLANFWRQTLITFGDHDALIGIDLLNEPCPAWNLSWYDTRHRIRANGNTHWDTWPLLAQTLVQKMRQVDPSAAGTKPRIAYIVEGAGDAGLNPFLNAASTTDTSYLVRDYTNANAVNPNMANDRIVYSSHFYDPMGFSSQGVYEWTYLQLGSLYPLPTGKSRRRINDNGIEKTIVLDFRNSDDLEALMQAEKKLANLGMPIFIGEFSAAQPNLDQVFPGNSAALSQRVSDVQYAHLDEGNQPKWIVARQITQIAYDSNSHVFTFGLDNIQDNFEPSVNFDPNAITSPDTSRPYYDAFTVNADGLPCSSGPSHEVIEAAGWPPYWFINQNLKATVHFVNTSGTRANTPVFSHVPIKLVGGDKFFKIDASAIPTVVAANVIRTLGTQDPTTQRYPVVALLTLESAATAADIVESQATYTKHVLQMFKRRKFSWAWFADDSNQATGVVCWRPGKEVNALLAKAARGETLT